MKTKIIAFAGGIGSGKDTCCKCLIGVTAWMFKRIPEFTMIDGELAIDSKVVNENIVIPGIAKNYKFATYLKQFCIEVLGLPAELVNGTQEDKNQLSHILWEQCPGVITNKSLYNSITKHIQRKSIQTEYKDQNFSLVYHEPGFMTVREVLQFFGTEVCRSMYNNCWVQSMMNQINRENPVFAFISDARFDNEFEAIKSNGGTLIKVDRPSQPSFHSSESYLNTYSEWDYIIDNNGSLQDLYSKLDVALRELNLLKI